MLDVNRTLISQYDASPTLAGLVDYMNQHLDPRGDIDAFFTYVWDIETAQGFGLDVWGEIVGVGRALLVPETPAFFGFDEAGTTAYPFGEAPFYDGSVIGEQIVLLSDTAYRQAILIKALSNISATTAPAINALLQQTFAARGRSYVADVGGMSIEYRFDFALTPYEFAILTRAGIIPRPAGVTCTLVAVDWPPTIIS